MSTTSSIDDYAAIAARLNEIEGKPSLAEQCDALRNRASRQEAENAVRRELLEILVTPQVKPGQVMKVSCPMCSDLGYVRRPAGRAGYWVEEQCPRCFNPQRRPPPGGRP